VLISSADPPQETKPPPKRLAWLDALRGVAAVAVLGEHLLQVTLPALRPYWFDLGVYGVLVFFLVSGYIIPASLERRGDLRAFWVARAFRLYPLYIAVTCAVLALTWWIPIRAGVPHEPATIAAHVTMLTDVIGSAGVVSTTWTLSYEMVFYLTAAALFATGAHRRSGLLAVLFALGAVASGLLLSAAPLSGGWLAWVSLAVLVVGLACVVMNRFAGYASCVLGVGAVVLVFLSSRVPWFGAAILAVMFTGSAIHRWERGTGPLWPVAVTGLLVALAPVWAVQAGWWWVQPDVWITTVALAGATFAAGMVLRARRVPRALAWLGVISYSLYLVHVPLLGILGAVFGDLRHSPLPVQVLTTVLIATGILLISALTHRLLEAPAQRLGRRVAGHHSRRERAST
jgi:peptidoglycan/LPS O-acetylase OafA/YrhL